MRRLKPVPPRPRLRPGPLPLLRPRPRRRPALPLGGLRLPLRRRPRRGLALLLRDRRFGRELPDALKPARPRASRRLLPPRRPLHARPRAARRTPASAASSCAPSPPAASPRLAPDIAAIADELIDALPPDASTSSPPSPSRCRSASSPASSASPRTMAPQLLAWSHAMVAMYQARRDRAVEDAANAAARDFAAFLAGHIAARRTRPADDLITALIAAEAEGSRLDTDELIATCVLLLNAGHEATVHAIGNGTAAILAAGLDPARALRHARSHRRHRRGDPPLRPAAPPLHPLRPRGRSSSSATASAPATPSAASSPPPTATRRASPTPPASTPPAPPGPQLSFGAGIHFCVGAPLARAELALALPLLFRRRPGLALAAPPVFADRYHFRGLTELRLLAEHARIPVYAAGISARNPARRAIEGTSSCTNSPPRPSAPSGSSSAAAAAPCSPPASPSSASASPASRSPSA